MKQVIADKNWEREVLANLFGEEDVGSVARDYENDIDYEIIVEIKRGNVIKND